jgi:hypothetical protein
MPKEKKLSAFDPTTKSDFPESAHSVAFWVKKRKNEGWFLKYVESSGFAIKETIGQEFFRMVAAEFAYPKTRFGKDETEHYYVLSKGIDFNPFFFEPNIKYKDKKTHKNNDNNYELIEKDAVPGLAFAQILALTLAEVDFRPHNVGTAKNGERNEIIKIDGGFCLFEPKLDRYKAAINIDFTHKDIEALPALHGYKPYNWLDLYQWSTKKNKIHENKKSKLRALTATSLVNFKAELHKAILRICLLPDSLIECFAQNYILLDADKTVVEGLAKTIIARRKLLELEANKIDSFKNYKTSALAQDDIVEYMGALKKFTTLCKINLVEDTNNRYKTDVIKTIYRNAIEDYLCIEKFLNCYNTRDLGENFNKIITQYLTEPTVAKSKSVYQAIAQANSQLKDEPAAIQQLIEKLILKRKWAFSPNSNKRLFLRTRLPTMAEVLGRNPTIPTTPSPEESSSASIRLGT